MIRSLCLTIAMVVPALLHAQGVPPEVHTAMPSRGSITRYVTAPGSLRAEQHATLFPKTGGYVSDVLVDVGDKVKQGQKLAVIAAPELEAKLKKAKAEAKLAQIDVERFREGRKKSPELVVQRELDKAEAAAVTREAEVAELAAILDYATIKAPFAGIVTQRRVDVGDYAVGGAIQNQPLFELMDVSKVRVETALPEKDGLLARTGQSVRVTLECGPEKTLEAVVNRTAGAIDPSTRTMAVQADVVNPNSLLMPGMYAKVSVGVEHHDNALLLTAAAVVFEKGKPSVFLAENGKARKKSIQTGFEDGSKVEILSGLQEGQPVLVPGKTPLLDGQPVKVLP
jgi:RND family efflux transporter MFP subunit